MSRYKLVSTRRSTVLSLPLQLGLPAASFSGKKLIHSDLPEDPNRDNQNPRL